MLQSVRFGVSFHGNGKTMKTDSVETFECAGFLGSMSQGAREKLLALSQSFIFERDQVVFQEGSPSAYFYLVKDGGIAVDIHIPSLGRRSILTAGPGEVVSWSAIVQPCLHHASARAIEPSELLGIRGDVLSAVCAEDPQFGCELYRQLAEIVSARLTATRLQMIDVLAGA
jgi:CRP-like cAMP-binding protein